MSLTREGRDYLAIGLLQWLVDWGVVVGLTLYNAAVIAELVRSGVHALPKGQTEAGLAEIIKGAKIFPIDEAWAGQNRKRIVERWIKDVLP